MNHKTLTTWLKQAAPFLARLSPFLPRWLHPRLPPAPQPDPPPPQPPKSPWQQELDDLLRGTGGAFLFGIPFLYTMEVWWKGAIVSPPHMLVALTLSYIALVALNHFTGFRDKQPVTWSRTLGDSIEALALALIMATLGLLLLRRIGPGMGLEAILGRIVMLAIPFSLGVGIANALLPREESTTQPQVQAQDQPTSNDHSWHGTLRDAGATMLGATIVAFAIAPTDEIPLISSALSPPWLLAFIATALLLSYVIVFEAEFGSERTRRTHPGIFQTPLSETVFSYLLSLVMVALMLWLFQLVQVGDPWSKWLAYIIVLGFPATIGGAAGRLAI
jgi:putative integral membrane protein (TIGR02587 family)